MMPVEKEQLLALLDRAERWCREAEALDASGEAVQYDHASAVAWDITGAVCRLFGWQRACVLFCQLDRHIHGKRTARGWPVRDSDIDAMAALQDFNDRVDMTYEVVHEQLATMPVWHGCARATA